MGTSKSSNGSPSRVPMVPPWVPDIGTPASPPETLPDPNIQPSRDNPSIPMAPIGRFAPARINFGKFAGTGSSDYMKRGFGHYVSKGYGGSNGATRRMGGTIAAGGRLYGVLSQLSGVTTSDFSGNLDRQLLQGKNAEEILDAIVNSVSPVDGTQDTEATRDSMSRALSSLLNKDENIDIMNLNEEQKQFVVQEFIWQDVTARFLLDCERTIKDKAPSLTEAFARIREIKDYIRETVSASFRKLKEIGHILGSRKATDIIKTALSDTFVVFEEYIL